MNKHTKRRKRRRENAKVRHGSAAVRTHAKKTGRTGAIRSKRTPGSKRVAYRVARPNPPGPSSMNLGAVA